MLRELFLLVMSHILLITDRITPLVNRIKIYVVQITNFFNGVVWFSMDSCYSESGVCEKDNTKLFSP